MPPATRSLAKDSKATYLLSEEVEATIDGTVCVTRRLHPRLTRSVTWDHTDSPCLDEKKESKAE